MGIFALVRNTHKEMGRHPRCFRGWDTTNSSNVTAEHLKQQTAQKNGASSTLWGSSTFSCLLCPPHICPQEKRGAWTNLSLPHTKQAEPPLSKRLSTAQGQRHHQQPRQTSPKMQKQGSEQPPTLCTGPRCPKRQAGTWGKQEGQGCPH